MEKRCTKCGEVKLLDEFHKKATGRYGRHNRCAVCQSTYQRAYMDSRRKGIKRTGSLTLTCRHCDSQFTYVKTSGTRRIFCSDHCAAAARIARDPMRRKNLERDRTLRRHGLTLHGFEQLLTNQGSKCAICKTKEPGGKHNQWHIDHDHACCQGAHSCGNCVRGLLCGRCNALLGYASDSTERLDQAKTYLLKHSQWSLQVKESA